MGARAIVAYERDRGYDLHRSQWGAERLALRWRLTSATPFGGGNPPPVDPVASHTAVGARTVAAALDPHTHEAFYLVDANFDVRPYLLARIDVPGRSTETDSATGLLAAPPDDDLDGCRLRARIEGARSAARALVDPIDSTGVRTESNDGGPVTPIGAPLVRRALRRSIAEWAARTIQLRAIDDGTF